MTDQLSTLTDNDIELLLDALDVWESAPAQDGFLKGILSSVFIKDEGKLDDKMTKTMDDANREAKLRRDSVILIKAKLVQMKNADVTSQLFGGGVK